MPNFDMERLFRARSEQDKLDLMRMQAQLKQRRSHKQRDPNVAQPSSGVGQLTPSSPEEEQNLVLKECTAEEVALFRRWQFSRFLVQEGLLSEWSDCCHTAGVSRLYALAYSAGDAPAPWSVAYMREHQPPDQPPSSSSASPDASL